MAFAFGGAGALLKAFVPTFPGLRSRRGIGAEGQGALAMRPPAALSPQAEAALASLDLPPDGPIDPEEAPRARLAPDVAARNFVRWAQALDLDGDYATRSIYALYCEFSEVDGRPPLRDLRFLEALAGTQGIATVSRGKDKARRLWRWTIEPAKPAEAEPDPDVADVWTHEPAPAPRGLGSTDALQSIPSCAPSDPASMPQSAPSNIQAPAPSQALAPVASGTPAAEAPTPVDAPAAATPAPESAVAPAVTKSASGRASKPAAPEAPQAPAADVPAAPADLAVAIKIQAPAVSQAPKAKSAKGQPAQTSTSRCIRGGRGERGSETFQVRDRALALPRRRGPPVLARWPARAREECAPTPPQRGGLAQAARPPPPRRLI